VVAEMKAQNILAGNFYWYDNNWHYIRKWDHLKQAASLNALAPDLRQAVIENVNKDFTPSDAIMSRCISTSISLLWTELQIQEKGQRMISVIKQVLDKSAVNRG
jgi:8-amino-3,8-dideoxy-alpha-D-manno-octulosonate transaminase